MHKTNRVREFARLIARGVKRQIPRSSLRFSVHLVEHCNLNCWGCDHFSPLAQNEFTDPMRFEKDFRRLSELFHGNARRIRLMGGEPLLHPQINAFLQIARTCFKKAKINVVTNGVLLMQMGDDFWDTCRQFAINIEITKYPIHLNLAAIQQKAHNSGVTLEFYGKTDVTQKTSYHVPLDVTGGQEPRRNYFHCFHANNCIFLKDGRLYTCTVAPNIGHFNAYYGLAIPLTQADAIDIYQAKSAREIMRFLAKPIPFCRYCLVEKRTFNHPWRTSERDISEWTVSCGATAAKPDAWTEAGVGNRLL